MDLRTLRLMLLACAVLVSGARAVENRGRGVVRALQGARTRRYQLTPFDLARRLVDLEAEQEKAIAALQGERNNEYREKVAELNDQLRTKYGARVQGILDAEDRDLFAKVRAAIEERDAAIQEARNHAVAALGELRPEPDEQRRARYRASFVPQRKQDILRYYVDLTEDQQNAYNEIRRDGFTALRDAMRDIPRPDNWRDDDARRQFAEAMRQAREDMDEQIAQATFKLLTPEQKKDYQAALTIVGAHDKKVKAAEEDCDKKLIALLGEERFYRLIGRPQPGQEDKDEPDKPAKDTDF
jgi:hypothetical protein